MRFAAFFLTLLGLIAAPIAWAQKAGEDHIETDRDSFTPALTTAGAGRLIIESGYSFIDNRDVPETHSFPELIARYGIGDWFELRVGTNYDIGGEANSITGSGGGFGDFDGGEVESSAKVLYGFKAALTDESGWLPRTAAIVQASTPTNGPESETRVVATYAWGWTIVDDWEWDSAIRYGDGATEEDRFDRWAPSTVVKVPLGEEWFGHLEYFGIFTDGREEELSQSYVSPGIHYLITPNYEVGIRVGWGLGGDAANFFSNVGLGLRF